MKLYNKIANRFKTRSSHKIPLTIYAYGVRLQIELLDRLL